MSDFAEADAADLARPGNRNPQPRLASLTGSDFLPPGPYGVGLTRGPAGYLGPPHTVVAGDGRYVSGHVPSSMIAQAMADALNRCYPVAE